MGSTRTAWHVLLAALLRQRGPGNFQVQTEVPLAAEPPRADYLLLRNEAPGEASKPAGTLRRLWPLLPRETIVEFKSARRTYRRCNLDRLWGYLSLHYADTARRLGARSNLAGVVLLPSRTRTLDADAAALGLVWIDLAGGYWQLQGGAFALYVVELAAVAEDEDDDLLHLLGHGKARTAEARRWLAEQVGAEESAMAMRELEGFDEVMRTLLAELPIQTLLPGLPVDKLLAALPPEQRLAGLPPEQRLAGMPPEQRLAGMPPEQRLAGMPPEQRLAGMPPEQRAAGLPPEQRLLLAPDEVLRLLPEDYLRSLPEDVQAQIRARIGRPHEGGT
ncbi:uncharacterized protein SOCE26_067600 [Sorangium cellulosum]|uniref:Uncharacterized protein n=1 Tax=Sorangium cellulosum TaxID=56 RepID=A0A2L0F1C9_SORCE|nr:hypothetical protein [Sorangium cellulosum]AUX45279.1 uncharacterized protein SOCE26_067600 [Sorangium cellulosum]